MRQGRPGVSLALNPGYGARFAPHAVKNFTK
jgi:hypothetical protein